MHINALPAYSGSGLPQAYWEGVVVGIQDIGFDLTHPNFYDLQSQIIASRGFGINCLPIL